MTILSKTLFLAYFGLTCFALGKFTYVDSDGYGFYVPSVGGYHVSSLESDL